MTDRPAAPLCADHRQQTRASLPDPATTSGLWPVHPAERLSRGKAPQCAFSLQPLPRGVEISVILLLAVSSIARSSFCMLEKSAPWFCLFVFFLGPHMEVPRLEVQFELQLLACVTATCIPATSATYAAAHGHARPGIEPASSWILVGFVEPQQEL